MKKHDAKANRRHKVRERQLAEQRKANQIKAHDQSEQREAHQRKMDELVQLEETMVWEMRKRQLETNPQTDTINTILVMQDHAHLNLVREAADKGILRAEDIGKYDGGY